MPSFGESGYRVRIFKRGRIWYGSQWRSGRESIRSLRTAHEAEAAAWAKATAAELKNGCREPKESVLYVLQRGEGGPVKVGITSNLDARLKGLKTAIPDLRVIAVYRMRDVELAVHRYLLRHHIEGEWFAIDALADLRELFAPIRPVSRRRK